MDKILFSLLLIIILIIYFTSVNSKKNEVESFNYSEKDIEKIALICTNTTTGNIDLNCIKNMKFKGNEIESGCSDPKTGNIDLNCVRNMYSNCRDPITGNIDLNCVSNIKSKGNEIESFNNIDRREIINKLNAYAGEEDYLLYERNNILSSNNNSTEKKEKIDLNTTKLRSLYKKMNAISNDVNSLTGILFNVDIKEGTEGVVSSTVNYIVRDILSTIIEKC